MAPQDLIAAKPKTKADFYAFIASEPEGRWEFEQGQIIAMPGGTLNHARIGARLLTQITRQLDEDEFNVLGPGRFTDTDASSRSPDGSVERVGADGKSIKTSEPILLVEVLSPDSRDRDLRVKAIEYTALTSLEAYIVAEQDKPICYVWVRDAFRIFSKLPIEISGKDGVIAVPALGLAIRLADIYRDHFRTPA